ncbi:MAG TPA: hypothetical protein EYP25_00500 [Anaerolineae bacterium]|nr:hypothetical protein [Caldilineae bacterium]HID33050.1 hypothetical protein [Anaerolineae bacterium]HIQ11511.1 hypothetical protein [Caldilineales bacterium]
MFLFKMKNGKHKLAYGETLEDALEILRWRLTEEEMEQIIPDDYVKFHPRQLQQYIDNLG